MPDQSTRDGGQAAALNACKTQASNIRPGHLEARMKA